MLLCSNTGILQWLGTNLVTRARRITAQLYAHRQMGREVEWDYDLETEEDTRIVKNSGDMDEQTAKLNNDAARFRLQTRKKMKRFSESPPGLDVHNFVRDTSGYHRIERVYKLSTSLEQLCSQCQETQQRMTVCGRLEGTTWRPRPLRLSPRRTATHPVKQVSVWGDYLIPHPFGAEDC